MPCIAGQLFQIFLGAGVAPFLARRVARHEANNSAAAGDLQVLAAEEGGSRRARRETASGQARGSKPGNAERKLAGGSGSNSAGAVLELSSGVVEGEAAAGATLLGDPVGQDTARGATGGQPSCRAVEAEEDGHAAPMVAAAASNQLSQTGGAGSS